MIGRTIGTWLDVLRSRDASDHRLDRVARELVTVSSTGARSIHFLLNDDVVLVVDGGADVPAPRTPLVGRDEVAAFLDDAFRCATLTVKPARVNARPGVVLCHGERTVGVLSFTLRRAAISRAWLVVNPDKLRQWNA
jgi:RNA polymerase sigma-70 factor (ECF subfamily)